MDLSDRIEAAMAAALAVNCVEGTPPRLAQALHHAVFPGGARIRPRLCLTVALANGDDAPAVADGAAVALEMLHCASLVHDDLPCFDDAPTRRGRPSVHRAFGEREAVLTGDALISMAFDTAARACTHYPMRTAALMTCLAAALSPPYGIIAGQAWECEPAADLSTYQNAKTGALFVAACGAGAIAAGAAPQPWRVFGERLGAAYQIADDIRDVAARAEDIGKPVGRDAALGRPNVVNAFGMAQATARFEQLVARASDSVPMCPGRQDLQRLIRAEARRLVPEEYLKMAV
jgi:geranylgeranyl diphosphate synthase type II